jgi:membrane-associated phospholipid phosphatase
VILQRLRAFLRARITREGAVGLYLTIGFLLCAAIVVVFGTLARFVFRAEGSMLDRAVTLTVQGWHTPGLDWLLRAVTTLGSHLLVIPATVAVTSALLAKRHRVSAVLFAGSVLGGFGLNSLLKWSFGRERPNLWPALVIEHTYSFPSGHTTIATAFFGGAVAVVFHLTRNRRLRLASLLVAAVVISGVAFSRVYLGAHWLTDVAGGLLVGLFWVTVCATGTEFFARRAPRPPAADSVNSRQ